MTHVTRVVGAACILTVALANHAPVASQSASPHADWPYFGGNKAFTRYSAVDQIDRDNVSGLRIAWRRPAVNPKLMAAFEDLEAPVASSRVGANGLLLPDGLAGLTAAGVPATTCSRTRSSRST